MDRPNLDGCWVKWEQGQRHLQTLDDEIAATVEPSEHRRVPFESYLESKTALRETFVFMAPDFEAPEMPRITDPRFAAIVGDTLNCFRGAIDHLAWQMVKRKGTPIGKLTRQQRRLVAFPLAARWQTYPEAFRRCLPGIRPDLEIGRLVKSFQACGRGRQASAMRALRDLGDRDKHRLLIPTYWFPEGVKFEVGEETKGVAILSMDVLIDTSRRVPIKSHQPLVRVSVAQTSLQDKQLELTANATFMPALGGRWWMMPTLHGIMGYIASLLYEAAPML